MGEAEKVPPSTLYWVIKPGTVATAGKANAVLHVLVGAVSIGAAGNTTKFFVSLQLTAPGIV